MSNPAPYAPYQNAKTGKYLLAPLQGLPFDEMVANGEGARHAGDAKYCRLILIHGLFATFAFLVFTPAAIICARFLVHGPRPRLAMWGHIGFQITSVFCLTVAFIVGYYAVGRDNWGKNPHHIIGATIYSVMLFQIFFGAFVRWRVQAKIRKAPPLHKMIHQWLGRAVFMLGLAQIPLGLYVYGSPLTLFILYAVLVFLFLASWFTLEYLRNRGWFTHKFGRRDDGILTPEMSEHHGGSIRPSNRSSRREGDSDTGYRPVNMDETPLQTPKKSRFSKLSWFVNRRPSNKETGQTLGMPPYDDGTTSMDTSRAPSSTFGGLAPGPGRTEEIPPMPSIPVHLEHPNSSGSIPSAEFQQRYGNPTGLKGTALRNSTTLGGPGIQSPLLQQPLEPNIPQSPTSGAYDPVSPIGFGHAPHPSDSSNRTYRQSHGYNMGGGYMEGDDGFVPTSVEGSPRRPLPLPPHRRERSNDSAIRSPIARSPEEPPSEIQPPQPSAAATAGQTSADGHRQPNLAVQVKLNPDGKSVTVRRLPPEEAERERRERSRVRQERARQREVEIDRERRRSNSLRGSRPQSHDRREPQQTVFEPPQPLQPTAPDTSYTPSLGGQSSTIAHASGGLLGRNPNQIHSPTNVISSTVGMQPTTRSPAPLGPSNSQRASVTSGTGTAENSEIEQEIIKEQRRRKRREERASAASQAGGSQLESGVGGGFYGPSGPESQWT